MPLVIFIVLGVLGFYFVVLPILVFTARGRIEHLEAEVVELRQTVANFRAQPVSTAVSAPAPAPTTVPTVTPAAAPPRTIAPAPPPPATAADRAPAAAPPVAAPKPPVPPPAAPQPVVAPAPPPMPPSKPAPPPAVVPPPLGAGAGAAAPPRGAAWPPPPPGGAPPKPPVPPPTPPAGGGGLGSFNWESLVGVKLFSAIAGFALLLATVFFLKFSAEQGWLQPPVRVAIGVIVGIALLVLCELRVANKYRVTANALDASAIGILFSTFFAAY